MKIKLIALTNELKKLLASGGLLIEDLSSSMPVEFYGIENGEQLIACIGVEFHDTLGLLRSLVVLPAYRDRGLGTQLVQYAEQKSTQTGIEHLYLLTSTAEEFFLKQGYTRAARDKAPASIRATAQFSALCPASSAFMYKQLSS